MNRNWCNGTLCEGSGVNGIGVVVLFGGLRPSFQGHMVF